ncbi:GTPase [Providencia sp. PROV031]|uniref:GTPase n=1 Tax=Providencia sp. PROV031 TaxID=2949763 RepID=UPI003FA7BEE7
MKTNPSTTASPFEAVLLPLPTAIKHQLQHKLSELIHYSPTIGLMGKTGVGKSSLCNALFQSTLCPISAVSGCTRSEKRSTCVLRSNSEL